MGIKVQNNSSYSNILLQNNILNSTLSPQTDFRCIVVSNVGSLLIDNNTFNIKNGQIISCISYDYGGNIELNNNSYNISSARKAVLINSIHSKYFNNAMMKITNCNFTFDVYNTKFSQPTIQYPESGFLIIDSCNINTSKSIVHEIVLQTFKNNSLNTSSGIFALLDNFCGRCCYLTFYMIHLICIFIS